MPARTALKNGQLTRQPPGERHAYFGDRTLMTLMPKMAHRSENHGHSALVPGGDNLLVPDRAPWLNGGRSTRFGRRDQTVRNREESIAAYRTPLQGKSGFRRFPCRDP